MKQVDLIVTHWALAYCLKWNWKTNAMKLTSMLMISALFLTTSSAQYKPGELLSEVDESHRVELRKLENKAFQKGEKLTYSVNYGFVTAGKATIKVTNETHMMNGREVLHVVGTGRSNGVFDWFFKVRDRYETYLDKDGVFPWLFLRDIEEGGYKKKQKYSFLQSKEIVNNGKDRIYAVPHGVQDMISAFYYARTFDFSNVKPGDIFSVPSFIDNEFFELKIKFLGIETIKVDKGKFNCMKFVPVVQEGRVFKKEEDMLVWITNDENKIPILAQAKILVGSVKMEIEDYEGLANPISKVKD